MKRYLPYLATLLSFLAGLWQKWPCHVVGWPYRGELIFGQRCYSDLPVLFSERGPADGVFPYATSRSLEYPVLTGYIMDLTGRLSGDKQSFFLLNLALLLVCALVTVWATIELTGRWQAGLLVAAAPVIALTGTINWDLVAVMFASLALLAWQRDRPGWTGVALGLGTAAKLYPVFLLFPLALVAWRSRRLRELLLVVSAGLGAWLLVNAPVMLLYPQGWAVFWKFNADRGAEFGSVFYALGLTGHPVEPLNPVAMGLLALCLLGIAAYALSADRLPDLGLLSLLTVAAFLVTNKVYSPQYVLWLLPLAVIAGTRLSVLLIWQAAEVGYWIAIWGHLAGTVDQQTYVLMTFARVASELLVCVSALIAARSASADGQLAPGLPVVGDRYPTRVEQVERDITGARGVQ